MKMHPTTRVTATPWVRKNRLTDGRPGDLAHICDGLNAKDKELCLQYPQHGSDFSFSAKEQS